jgi:hypothetical protein
MARTPQSISQPHTALLLGNYRPALAVARALSAAGYGIAISAEGDEGGCERSRHVDEVWDHPPLAEGSAVFIDGLGRFLEHRLDVEIVFPIGEEFVNLLADAGWTPPEGVALVGPGSDVVRTFADKIATLHLSYEIGVRTLPFEVVSDHGALFKASARIGFPITVRPLGTTARLGHKKALIAATPEQLIETLPEWPQDHRVLLLQRCAVGQRHNVYFAAQDGELIGVVASRIQRTNHPEGTGLAVCGETIVPPAALVRDTEALVAHQGYTGVGLAQFIVDPETGDRCFLELNPRVSGSHAVPEGAGVPLSAIAVDLARGVKIGAPAPYLQGQTGLHYVWTCGALFGAKLAYLRGELGLRRAAALVFEACVNAIMADVHMVWSWDDPKPALRALCLVLPKFTRVRAVIGAVLPWRRDAARPA